MIMLPAYPNPFNPSTVISFDLSDADMVSLDIFDIAGRQVASLISEYMIPGSHQIVWNPGQLSSGIYFVKLIAGNTSLNQKITYVK
ncbi:MAG TPA: T9SS type A sorting domain-containing protein [Candidatus Marinimicrobia bacterium]|nr:T9SS type A sorting domain-containing protein [Candidatus Neomarinimicrobiota bacterium]